MTCAVCSYQPSYDGGTTCPRCGAPITSTPRPPDSAENAAGEVQTVPGPTPGATSDSTYLPAWLAAGETVDRSALRHAQEEAERAAAVQNAAPSAAPPYAPADAWTASAPAAHSPWHPANQPYPGHPALAGPGYVLGQPPPASIGARFAAYLLDGLILMVPLVLIGLAVGAIQNAALSYASDPSPGAVLLSFLAYAIGIAYPIWGWSRGQTFGMQVAKIQLVDENSLATVGVGRAIVRWLMMAVMGLPCYLGYISILTDSSGYYRGWNDKAANSRMIRVG